MLITVNGIDVNVIKKPIKNLHLYVKPPYALESVG